MTISASLKHAPPILLSEIIEATAPEIIGNLAALTEFRWIERNSREIKGGDLFIAVRGERFDGHDFVGDAASRGAAAALVSKEWAAATAADSEIPLIAVDEPVMALQRIAAARRARMALQVVGVTGSIGKSSTKEVIASVLRTRFPTYHSPGNMNSEIGLPLSLLEIAPETECAVLEMGGAYAFGELALLANIAKPVVGVVTNVHPVHLERMGTIEAIAKTKAELVEALPACGVAVLNGDDVRVRAMAAQTQARVVTYGRGSENVVRASDIQTRGLDGITFDLHLDGTQTTLTLPMVGRHAVDLALAAVSVGWAMGLRLDEMIGGLADRASQIRLLTKIGPRGAQLIDDTYNASAPSVLSALGLLQEIECERRIAVLGEMRELGAESASQHQQVGQRAGEVVDVLATFGPMGRLIADAAREAARSDGRDIEIMSFDLHERDLLVRELEQSLQAGDTVLLKGSRGLMMETIVDSLESSNPSDHQS